MNEEGYRNVPLFFRQQSLFDMGGIGVYNIYDMHKPRSLSEVLRCYHKFYHI